MKQSLILRQVNNNNNNPTISNDKDITRACVNHTVDDCHTVTAKLNQVLFSYPVTRSFILARIAVKARIP